MSSYLYASVIRQTEYDPRNDRDAGTVFITAGKHDEYSYTVVDEEAEGFRDIECEVLGWLEADYRMGEKEIEAWAGDQEAAVELAKEAAK